MLMGARRAPREEVAIKNVVQGRRLEGDSPWLLFFVLSTLAPSLALALLTLPPSLFLSHFLPFHSLFITSFGFYVDHSLLLCSFRFFLGGPFNFL